MAVLFVVLFSMAFRSRELDWKDEETDKIFMGLFLSTKSGIESTLVILCCKSTGIIEKRQYCLIHQPICKDLEQSCLGKFTSGKYSPAFC